MCRGLTDRLDNNRWFGSGLELVLLSPAQDMLFFMFLYCFCLYLGRDTLK